MIALGVYPIGLKKMSREKNLAKNTIVIAVGTFLPKLSGIITLPIITAGLTKQEYGTYDLVSTLVSLFLPIVTLQMQAAAFRYLIDCRENETEVRRIITNILVFIIPVSLVGITFLYAMLYRLNSVVRMLICVYFFVDILMLCCQQIVRGLSNNKLYSVSAVICSVANMLLIVLLVRVERQGLVGVLSAMVVATLVGLGVLVFKCGILQKLDFTLLSWKTIKSLLNYSWPMIPNSLSIWVLNFSDRLVLTTFLGLEATAVYAVATKIPSLFSTVQNTFVFAWQENASLATKDTDIDAYYSKMFDNIMCILVGIMALLIATAPILFAVLIRGDYCDAYHQMGILFLGTLFSALSSFLGGIYIAHKKTKSVGITTMMAAVLNLLLDLLLVNWIGVYAASVSTLISYVVLVVYRMIDILKFQKVYYNIKKMTLLLIILSFMCSLGWKNNLALNLCNIVLGITVAIGSNYFVIRVILKEVLGKGKTRNCKT